MTRPLPETSERDQVTLLLSRVAAADRAAFRALYDRTSSRLFAICLRIVRDRPVAEDVLQEVYIRIWERARLFDPARGSGLAWIISIARNSAIDLIRARGRNIVAGDIDSMEVPDLVATRTLEATVETHALRRCLDGLEERARQAIVLAYRDGLTYEELAAQLDVPAGTVKTWVRRGIVRLRGCMDNEDE